MSQNAAVDIDIQPVLSIALERPSISFGNAIAGDTPAAVSERVTVSSNNAAGYALTVHRSAFAPADLPLGLSSTAPSGGQLGGSLAGGAMAAIPIAPAADLLIGTTAARSAQGGDAWAAKVGFVSPLPVVAPGRYSATVDVHRHRAMIAAARIGLVALTLVPASAGASAERPPVALTASPSHVALAGSGRSTVRLTNGGSNRVVVDVTRAGFALDLRGRPKIVGGDTVARSAAGWLTFRPRSLSLKPGGSASIAIASKLPSESGAG